VSDGAVDLNFISIGVSRVKIFSETGAQLSDASGFFVVEGAQTFFVTAWHVVSGRNFHSKKHLHPSGALPDHVKLTFWGAKYLDDGRETAEFKHFHDLIRLDGLEGSVSNPKNLHPTHGSDIDVIAFDITPLANSVRDRTGFEVVGIQLPNDARLRPISVMDQVFIPGHPVIHTPKPNEMPIYKAASIASEPNVFQGVPSVFLDGKTKKGWSGSPVIRKIPAHMPKPEEGVFLRFEQFALYGIYSGRDEHDTELISAELGYCWPVRECLVPIVEGLRRS
jgi:hypothetical protein